MTASHPGETIRKDGAKCPDCTAGMVPECFEDAYGIHCVARLDRNENPSGPWHDTIRAMAEAAPGVWRFPDPVLIALMSGARIAKLPFGADGSFPEQGICDDLSTIPRGLIFSPPSNPVCGAMSKQDFREVIAAMIQTRDAIGVSPLAAIVATEAFRDTDHLMKVVGRAIFERDRVTATLDAKDIDNIASQTNCVVFDTGADADILVEKMRKKGIPIKAWQGSPYET